MTTRSLIQSSRLSELEAHLDAGGKFTHENAVELLGCVRGMEWQDIATAPKGQVIQLWLIDTCWLPMAWVGNWSFVAEQWQIYMPVKHGNKNLTITGFKPTHWRHLPPAPKTETATKED